MGKRKLSEKMTVNAAARFLGVHPAEMQAYIDAGRIISTDGCISRLLLEDIRERQEKYISLRDYLKGHDGGLFDSRLVRNREKYIDFLEGHGYFGIQTIDPEAFILKASEKEGCFIAKEDLSFLDYKSQDFFAEFGLSEQEKTDRIISVVSGHDHTKDCVAGYLNHIHDEGNIYTPSLTDFARIVFELPDIIYVTDEDILNGMESAATRKTRELLTGFFAYAASRKSVSYHSVGLKCRSTWSCREGHEWKSVVSARTGKDNCGCPYCYGRYAVPGVKDLETVNPELASEWHPTKNKTKPSRILPNSNKKAWWLCPECGYEWRTLITSRSARGSGCPRCLGRVR